MLSMYTRDLGNFALFRKRAPRKELKANEDRVKAVVDLLGRLQAFAEFQGGAMKGAGLFQKGPSTIQQAFLKQDVAKGRP
eukprot:397596-Lingulodinium_polyedra.AAC.1